MSSFPVVDMSIDTLLTTTRSVRKRLDLTRPVPVELIRECMDIALQAPTSSNVQNWSFIVVTDAEQRRAIGDVYRRKWEWVAASPFAVADRFKDDPIRSREQQKVSDSAVYLAEHMGQVPTHVVPCVQVDGDGKLTAENAVQYWSSIMPAAWSYMLAARSRGLGTTWTGVTTMAEDEMRAVLHLPANVYHATTIPTAYYTGTAAMNAKFSSDSAWRSSVMVVTGSHFQSGWCSQVWLLIDRRRDPVLTAHVARRGHAGMVGVHDALVFGIVGDEVGDKSAVVGELVTALTQIIEDRSDQLCAQTLATELGLDHRVADDDATTDPLVHHDTDDLVVDDSLVAILAVVIGDLHD
jgi:nitroreductase